MAIAKPPARTDRQPPTKNRCPGPFAHRSGRIPAPSSNVSCAFPVLTRPCLTARAATKTDYGAKPRKRTSAVLRAAKARGKRLGNPKLSEARRHAAAARKEKADRYSANVLPVIREIQRSGVKSLRGVARALAARGIPTARGGAWTPVQVSDILRRAR